MRLVALSDEEINLIELMSKDVADYMENDPTISEDKKEMVDKARKMGDTIYDRVIK